MTTAQMDIVNGMLLTLRPPSELARQPRSCDDKAKWKATESRVCIAELFVARLPAPQLTHFRISLFIGCRLFSMDC